jgi:hypothetical protein
MISESPADKRCEHEVIVRYGNLVKSRCEYRSPELNDTPAPSITWQLDFDRLVHLDPMFNGI